MKVSDNYLLLIHLFAFAGWACCVLYYISSFVKKGYKHQKLWLFVVFAIVASALIVRLYAADRSIKIFYDEYEMINMSRALVADGEFYLCIEGNLEKCDSKIAINRPGGYVFIGAVAIVLSGKDTPDVFFDLNAILGALSLLLIAAVAFNALGDLRAGAYASALASVIPINVVMATNASSEMLNFAIVCSIWAFYFSSNESVSYPIVSKAGVLFSILCAMLTRPENLVLPAFFLLASFLFPFKPLKERFNSLDSQALIYVCPYLLLLPLIDLYLNVYRISRAHFAFVMIPNILELLGANFSYMLSNPYISIAFFVPAAISFILFFKDRKHEEYILLLYLPFCFFYLSAIKVNFFQGDWPRTLQVMTLPIAVLGGAGFFSALRLKNRFKYPLIILFIVPFAFFNPKPPAFHPAMIDFNKDLQSLSSIVPEECSILAVNPSTPLFHSRNKAYGIDKLFDPAFMAEHHECKAVLYDVFCSYQFQDVCERAKNEFPQKLLYSKSYSYFRYELTLIQ